MEERKASSATDRAHLERVDGVGEAALHQLAHRVERLGSAVERDEVLQLVEVGVVDHREDAVAPVDAAAHGVVVRHVRADLVVDLDVALVGQAGSPWPSRL